MTLIWFFLGVTLAIGAMIWWSRRSKTKKLRTKASLWKQLRRVASDPAVVRRLLAAERERNPDMSETQLLKKVLRRLTRDRK